MSAERIVELLNLLAGQGRGEAFLEMLDAGEPSVNIANEIVRSLPLEARYKAARASDFDSEALMESDFAYVGLPLLDLSQPFERLFEEHLKPRLAHRAEGFEILFRHLVERPAKPLIVETGTLRIPGNWEGDGQSTIMFDIFTQQRHGTLFSIDINPRSIETARQACSSAAILIANDSVFTLNFLSRAMPQARADLLYLDSFDFDGNNPMPSAIHHILEMSAAGTLVGPGTMICVDDYGTDRAYGGKGLLVEMYLKAIRALELYTGYQKIWLVP